MRGYGRYILKIYNIVDTKKDGTYVLLIKSPGLGVIQQNSRRIVLPLLTKALYKIGCFNGIFQKAKVAPLLIY